MYADCTNVPVLSLFTYIARVKFMIYLFLILLTESVTLSTRIESKEPRKGSSEVAQKVAEAVWETNAGKSQQSSNS